MQHSLLLLLQLSGSLAWSAGLPVRGGGAATLSVPMRGLASMSAAGEGGAGEYGDIDTVQNPSQAIAKLKEDMKAAQAKGDFDTVIKLMGTLLALEGGYENEAGEEAGGSSREGRCAD